MQMCNFNVDTLHNILFAISTYAWSIINAHDIVVEKLIYHLIIVKHLLSIPSKDQICDNNIFYGWRHIYKINVT